MKQKRKLWITLAAVALVLVTSAITCGAYLGDYYRADTQAIEAFAPMQEAIVHTLEDGTMVFEAEGATTGFIFYPGGKVEASAYRPLMAALAQKGYFCVLIQMPFNLAVLDAHAADTIPEQYPQIRHWCIGGHSLGGAMAASCVASHPEQMEGLVLLGAYATKDLSDSGLAVLSVVGSEDKVMNREKYDKYRGNLPTDCVELEIEGGCHAYFGMYGFQEGDGTPTVTNEEQIMVTADAIAALLGAKS